MRNQNINEVLLSRKETSQLLKISLPTLYRWTKDGTLTSYYMGSRVYYKYSEIMESLHKSNQSIVR